MTNSHRSSLGWLLCPLALAFSGACGDATEAPRVELPIVVDGSSVDDVTTTLGYRVQVTTFRMAVSDIEFTAAGEIHARRPRGFWQLLRPVARAHPGHYTGGEVIGELAGEVLPDWLSGQLSELGVATLIAGTYESANFSLSRGQEGRGLERDDPLLGHTALIEGRAVRDGEEARFVARIDSPEGRQIVGAPFEVEIRGDTRTPIGFAVVTVDPLEGDTLFDGIDFLALAPDQRGLRVLEEGSADPEASAAYQILRRTLQTHDHFRFRVLYPER